MCKRALVVCFATIFLMGATSPAFATSPTSQPTAAVDDGQQDLQMAQQALRAAQGGQWWLFAALAVSIFVGFLKSILTKKNLWNKLGRWRYGIVPVLSVAVTLLAAFQGGVSWQTALAVFTSTNTMATLQVVWDRVVLGNP